MARCLAVPARSTRRAPRYLHRGPRQVPVSRYAGGVLRTRPWRSASLRLLTDHDRDEVLALCDRDAITNVFVSARIRSTSLDPSRLGGQLWGYSEGGQLTSVCYSGANLVPVAAGPEAI